MTVETKQMSLTETGDSEKYQNILQQNDEVCTYFHVGMEHQTNKRSKTHTHLVYGE